MKKALKLAAYVTVLSLATVVVFAGPCEEGCEFNNTQCTNEANASYSQCLSNVQTNNAQCYAEADAMYQNCMATAHQQEQGICNSLLQQAQTNCMYEDMSGSYSCENTAWQSQQNCANDYENCLFICSNQ